MTEPRPSSAPQGPLRGPWRPFLAVAALALALGGAALLARHAQPHGRAKAAPHAVDPHARSASAHVDAAPAHARADAQPSSPEASAQPPAPTGLIIGTVVDELGSPVEATVFALRSQVPSDAPLTARASKDGRFKLRVDPHWWTLWAATPDSISAPGEVMPGREGDPLEVKLVVRPSAHVEGTVYDPDGRPCEGAYVFASACGRKIPVPMAKMPGSSMVPRPLGVNGLVLCARAVSDPHGTYRVDVPSGGVLLAAQLGTACSKAEPIRLVAAQHSQLDLHLEARKCLTGRVTDVAGHPIVGAEVSDLFYQHDQAIYIGFPTVVTDQDGQYRLVLLESHAGEAVWVHAVGYSCEGGSARRHPVDKLDFVLHPGATIRGVVRLADGIPVGGARIEQRDHARDPSGPNYSLCEERPLSLEDGSFEIEDASPGQSVVEASHESYATSDSAPFEVEEGGTVVGIVVVFHRGACVHGRVLDATTRAPIEGALVEIQCSEGGGPSWGGNFTGKDGSYGEEHIGPGHHRFRISHDGYATQLLEVDLAEGDDLEKDVLLGKGCTVRVRVALGADLASDLVVPQLCRLDGKRWFGLAEAGDAAYEARGLDGGTYYLSLLVTRGMKEWFQRILVVEVEGESSFERQIHFSAGPQVRGRVRQAGLPVAQSAVALVGCGAKEGNHFIAGTDENGHIAWHGVDPGDYLVTADVYVVHSTDCPAHAPVVRVPEGVDSLDVEVDLPAK